MNQQPRKRPVATTLGQTSLDFMMTYGWALLLVVVVVSSLFALGVFNAGSFLGPRATGFAQVGVLAWNVNAAGVLALRLQNFAGMDITVINIEATFGNSHFPYDITNVSIPNGKVSDTFTVGAISGLAPGQYYTMPLRITYTDFNGFNYTETGTISGTVGAGAVPPLVRINSPHSDSILDNRTINISVSVWGNNLTYTDIMVIDETGTPVNVTTNSQLGTYAVELSVDADGAYNITALAHYSDGGSASATASNITVNTTGSLAPETCGTGSTAGMVSYWKFDDGSGTTARDSYSADDGQIAGAAWTSGEAGGALSFDGNGDYVTVDGLVSSLAGSTTGSIEFWMNATDTNNEMLAFGISNGASSTMSEMFVDVDLRTNAYWLTISLATDNTRYWQVHTDPYSLSPYMSDWVHVAITHDGTSPRMYFNGVEQSLNYETSSDTSKWFKSILADAATPANTADIGALNRNGLGYWFTGSIDEFAVYNRPLTESEIQQHYQAGLSGQGYCNISSQLSCVQPPSGLVYWWPGDGNASDIIGSNTGAWEGTEAYAQGEVGQAFSFDGSSDVALPSLQTSDDNTYTWDFWLRDDSSTPAYRRWLVTITGGFINTAAVRESGAGEIEFYAGSAYAVTSGHGWKGAWHNYAFVSDGSSTILYEDGNVLLTSSAANVPEQGFYIGGHYYGSEYAMGLIDEVQIYDRALSQQEVQAIYNAGGAGVCTNASAQPSFACGLYAAHASGPMYMIDFNGTASQFTNLGQDTNFDGVTADSSGNLYAVNYSGSVVRIAQDGTVSQFADVSSYGSGYWFKITADDSGNLYAIEYNSGIVAKITSSGAVSQFADLSGYSGSCWSGLTWSPGNLYAFTCAGPVVQITPSGSMSQFADLGGTYWSWHSATDGAGNLYALDYYGYLKGIAPDGTVSDIASIGTQGCGNYDVATDSLGNSYALDYCGHVAKVTPDGNVSELVNLGTSTWLGIYNYARGACAPQGQLSINITAPANDSVLDSRTITINFTVNGTSMDHTNVTIWGGRRAVDNYVWVTNVNENTVSKIDKSTDTVVTNITVGSGSYGVAVDDRYVWVTNYNDNTVSKIDKLTDTVVDTISVSGGGAWGASVDPDYVWVINGNTVSKIDKATDTEVATISVGSVWGITGDRDYLWVSNYGSYSITKINKDTGDIVSTIPTDQYPLGISVDNDYVWVVNSNCCDWATNVVTKINKTDDTVLATIPTGGSYPGGVAADASSVWAVNGYDGTVSRINKSTDTTVATIAVGSSPNAGVAVNDYYVWVANTASNDISKIDKATGTVVATIPVGTYPSMIGDATGYAYDMFFSGSEAIVVNSTTTSASGDVSVQLDVPSDGVYSITATAYDNSGNSASDTVTNITVSTAPGCVQQPSGLVAWWPGDDNATDIIGGNDGTWNGNLAYASGEVNQAFSFDGNSYVESPGDQALGSAFTMGAWVNTTDGGVGKGIVTQQDCNRLIWLYQNGNTAPGVPSFDPGGWWLNADVSVNDGQWHYVVGTYDGTTASIYVDGVLRNSLQSAISPSSNPPFDIGGGGCAQGNLVGDIDEVQFYDRALSDSEIRAIYDAGSAGMCRPEHVTHLSDCGNISYSGDYVLAGDVSNGGTCFTIEADNVTLDCNGSTITGPGGSGNGIDNSAGHNYTTVKNCVITNFNNDIEFDGANYGTIENNTVSSNSYNGIWLGSSSNNTVSNNNVSSSSYAGIILLSSSNNNTVTNNNVSSNTNLGIFLASGSDYNTVSNNTASSNNIGIILSDHADYNTVSNNTANSNSGGQGWGIYLESSSDYNNITNNNASNNGNHGIYLTSNSDYNTIADNTATSDSQAGIYFSSSSNNTIANNTASSNGWIGIYLTSSSNNIISNNTASSNSNAGIYLTSGSNNNIISDNTASLSTNGYGIALFYSSDSNTIANNNASNNYGYGIIFWPSCDYNTIANNTASNSASQGGISLQDHSNYNNVTNNTVANNAGDGIEIDWYTSNNIVSNNIVSDNAGSGIWFATSSNTLVYNNFFNNSANAYIDPGSTNNFWNTTLDCGTTNIVGGPCIGGNFWAQPDGNGWSETPSDCNANSSDLCASPYSIPSSSDYDYLPLTNPASGIQYTGFAKEFGSPCAGLSAGWYNTCVLTSDGNVNCWGGNDNGESAGYTGGNAVGVSAGAGWACALLDNGNTACWGGTVWGGNTYGQATDYTGGDATGVSSGADTTCILLSNGDVFCQGYPDNGGLAGYQGGDAIGVASGWNTACALLSNGDVSCWGYGGNGEANPYTGSDATGVSAGAAYECALRNNNDTTCWGYNGDGRATSYTGGDAVGVSAGGSTNCVLTSDGNVHCVGGNYSGETIDYNGGNAVGVSAGGSHTCVLTSNGNVQCWGDNTYGQLADYTGGDAVCSR